MHTAVFLISHVRDPQEQPEVGGLPLQCAEEWRRCHGGGGGQRWN
jgi:hypothetical protein